MKWFNRDHAVWTVNEIKKRKGVPYMMANEELAVDIFPYIVEQYPEAVMVKLGIEQWIAVNKRSRKSLHKRLEARIDGHLKCISEIESAIGSIRCAEGTH